MRSQTPAVAPLPLWPIAGIEFSPSLHLRHVLAVFGCHEGCPAVRSDLPYYGSVYANARNSLQTFQVPTPYTMIVEALWDFSVELVDRHDHPIDTDLVYPYVRIHSFPFTFSRPILVYIPTFRCARYFHVSDIHLRWSEIRRGLEDVRYAPSRYLGEGYPFNATYFREACKPFELRIPATPSLSPFIHRATGLPVEMVSYEVIRRRITALAPSSDREVVYLLRVPTAESMQLLQKLYQGWWLHGDFALRRVRYGLLCNWLDRGRQSEKPHDFLLKTHSNAVVLADFTDPFVPDYRYRLITYDH